MIRHLHNLGQCLKYHFILEFGSQTGMAWFRYYIVLHTLDALKHVELNLDIFFK